MNRSPTFFASTPGTRRRQRGVSLIFALITVAALSLAAVAMIRSVDTGTGILGNLSFKQDSLLASDEATRQAITWLGNNIAGNTLNSSLPDLGYSARHLAPLDVLGQRPGDASRVLIDWADKPCSGSYATCVKPLTLPALSNGVQAQYLILRLCTQELAATEASNVCSRPLSSGSSVTGERNEIGSQNSGRVGTPVMTQYFRIIVRSRGARQTVSTTETLVHF